MDFEIYSAEEEQFRLEVRAWIQEHLPEEIKLPETRREETVDRQKMATFRQALADRGWAAPTWPVDWGGGGLTGGKAAIIDEELDAASAPFWPGNIGRTLIAPAVWVWGSEEQKRRFIPPLIRGEYLPYQLFTEPDAGSDLASMKTRAVKDGDDFIITGQKHFVGNAYDPEWFWLLAVTDPSAGRHRNLGAFLMPATLPGVTVETMDMVITEVKRRVYLDEVRVSREYLIGGETDGWPVSQSTLEMEHGGGGGGGNWMEKRLDQVIDFAKSNTRHGQPLSKDPAIQRAITDLYVQSQVVRLFGLRNQWMHHARQPMSYEGSQYTYLRKDLSFSLAQAILEIAGPASGLTDEDEGPYGGAFEHRYREALNNSHPAGTVEIHKLIISRRLGLGRKAEKPAPTAGF